METPINRTEISKSLDQLIDQFIELFSANIRNNPTMEEHLNSKSSLEHHNELMRNHLKHIYANDESGDSFELSQKVGRSHIKYDVRLSWYLLNYNKIFEVYHASQAEDILELPDLDEFRRIWLVDAGNTLDAYYELLVQQHLRENRLLQESLVELDIQAKTDPLTEILNRRGLRHEIDNSNSSGIFILLDLDNFKSVNDLQGHLIGDKVLTDIAKGLTSELRKGDLIGRIGGDEFSLWLPAPVEMTTGEIKNIVRRLFADIPFEKWKIGISGGIVMRPEDGTTFDELYAKADSALYRAKLKGPSTLFRYGTNEIIDITQEQ